MAYLDETGVEELSADIKALADNTYHPLMTYVGDSTQGASLGAVSQNTASGQYAIAEGRATTASGNGDHAEGVQTYTTGGAAHAEGLQTSATYGSAHTEGRYTLASAAAAHAEGWSSTASGQRSHAQGTECLASTNNACAGGASSTASHVNSLAYGSHVYTTRQNQVVVGQYNRSDDTSAVFLVGNGTSSSAQENAFTVHTNGRVSAAADAVNDWNLVRFGQVNIFDEHNNVSSITCSNGSWATLCSTTLTPGLFLIDVHAECSSSSVGRRALIISTSSSGTTGNLLNKSCKSVVAPVNGDVTTVKIQTLLNITSNTQIWCRFWQNSGSSKSIQSAMRLVKLK